MSDSSEDYCTIAEEVLEGASQGLIPGKFLVDVLPFLRYIPTWLPGTSSQKLFAKWQAAADKLKNVPFNNLKAALVSIELITIRLLT